MEDQMVKTLADLGDELVKSLTATIKVQKEKGFPVEEAEQNLKRARKAVAKVRKRLGE